jgi:MoaA/NifB/PqqE/SkfB family radical SAM enzyme
VSIVEHLRSGARRVARTAVGAISPGLLRRIQLSRARRTYLREPVRGPHRLLLEPTTGCNHRCIMCWDHSPRLIKPTPAQHMPFERIESLLREMAEMGTEEVWLAGRGEPLVHPRAETILELIGSLGMRSIITTNAGVLTEELADRLCDCGLQQISISIDSGTPETYAKVHGAPPADRARILGLIGRLAGRAEPKPAVLVSMVISQWNFRELLDLVKDAIAAGATGLVIGGMRPVPFDSADLALNEEDWGQVRDDLGRAGELARSAGVKLAVDNIRGTAAGGEGRWPYEKMACFIGHRFTTIDVDGTVHGCCTCQNALGALDELPFRDIWRSRQYRLFRRILREMPSTGLTPPRCECRHGCGHVPENAHLQEQFGFTYPAVVRRGGFVTRADAAGAVCRYLDNVLPARERDYGFADLVKSDVKEAASRLRQVGAMAGVGSMDGVLLFEPRRLVARGEFEGILKRALVAAAIPPDRAASLSGRARAGTGHPAEPLLEGDMARWLAALRASLAGEQPPNGRRATAG